VSKFVRYKQNMTRTYGTGQHIVLFWVCICVFAFVCVCVCVCVCVWHTFCTPAWLCGNKQIDKSGKHKHTQTLSQRHINEKNNIKHNRKSKCDKCQNIIIVGS